MKRCPKCNDLVIYDDSVMACPICDTPLTSIQIRKDAGRIDPIPPAREAENNRRRVVSPQTAQGTRTAEEKTSAKVVRDDQDSRTQESRRVIQPVINSQNAAGPQAYNERAESRRSSQADAVHNQEEPSVPRFETHLGGRLYSFRGSVAEVNSHSRYYNQFHKVVNTISQSEPYQFGHTNYETVIRIEEFTVGRLPSQARTLIMYGDIEGNVHPGDDVEVRAVRRGDRYVIRSLRNNQTGSYVTPGPQISALTCFFLVILAVFLIVSLVYGIVTFFTGGGFEALFTSLVGFITAMLLKVVVALLPILIILYILSLLTGIGRRR